MRAPQVFIALLFTLACSSLVLAAEDRNVEDVEKHLHVVLRVKAGKPIVAPTKNPLGIAFGTIYKGLVMGYIYLGETSRAVYDKQIHTRLSKAKTEATQKANELLKAASESTESLLKSAKEQKESAVKKFEDLLEVLKTSSASVQETLHSDLMKMSDIVVRMKDPDYLLATDESDLKLMADNLVAKLTGCIIEENPSLTSQDAEEDQQEESEDQEEKEVEITYADSVKSYAIGGFNKVLRVLISVIGVITANVNLVTLFSGIVCLAAVYLSVKLGLAFLRVFIWICKLPFRILGAVFRYIFGYSSEVDVDVDEEALIDACKDNEDEEAVPQKRSSVRRLDGFDGISTDNVLEADLVADSEDELEYLEADESELEVLAASDKGESPKPSAPTTAPSSAAAVSTLAVLVATVALLI